MLSRTVSTFVRITQCILSQCLGKVHVGFFPEVVIGVAVWALEFFGFAVLEGLTAPDGKVASFVTPSFSG